MHIKVPMITAPLKTVVPISQLQNPYAVAAGSCEDSVAHCRRNLCAANPTNPPHSVTPKIMEAHCCQAPRYEAALPVKEKNIIEPAINSRLIQGVARRIFETIRFNW
jgi:hypothetical protein